MHTERRNQLSLFRQIDLSPRLIETSLLKTLAAITRIHSHDSRQTCIAWTASSRIAVVLPLKRIDPFKHRSKVCEKPSALYTSQENTARRKKARHDTTQDKTT
jgi:hypothetical protein